LLEELKAFILAKFIDEAGNLKYDLKPTSGEEDSGAYERVLSSDAIYKALLNFYNKDEVEE